MGKTSIVISIGVMALVLVGGPIVLGCFVRTGSANDWLGFWGSILGTIPAGLIAYWVVKFQLYAEQKNSTEGNRTRALPYFEILATKQDGIDVLQLKYSNADGQTPIISVDAAIYSEPDEVKSKKKFQGWNDGMPKQISYFDTFFPDRLVDMPYNSKVSKPDEFFGAKGLQNVEIHAKTLDGGDILFYFGNRARYHVYVNGDVFEVYGQPMPKSAYSEFKEFVFGEIQVYKDLRKEQMETIFSEAMEV